MTAEEIRPSGPRMMGSGHWLPLSSPQVLLMPVRKTCGGMKARQADCFVRSRWCSELCDVLDISVEAYRKAYRKKLRAEKRKKRKVFNDV